MDKSTEQTTVKPCCTTARTPAQYDKEVANQLTKDSHGNTRTPLGKFQDLHGLRTYLVNPPSRPEDNNSKGLNTIIILTNVFGPDYIHNQLVADEWAQEGFKVVVPDLLEGDPLPDEYVAVSFI